MYSVRDVLDVFVLWFARIGVVIFLLDFAHIPAFLTTEMAEFMDKAKMSILRHSCLHRKIGTLSI